MEVDKCIGGIFVNKKDYYNKYEYIYGTICNSGKASLRRLVNNLVDDGIATRRKKSKDGEQIYIGEMSDVEGVQLCLESQPDTIKQIENWEFNNFYRYSSLFDIQGFSIETLNSLEKEGKIIPHEKIAGHEELYVTTMKPSVRNNNNEILLKFNLKIQAENVVNEIIKRKYSIVVLIKQEEHILEIRFNPLERIFDKNRFRYVYSALAWLREYLSIKVTPIDFRETTEYLKVNGNQNKIVLSGEDMRMSSGGKATIDVGNDEKQILPFIGELKEIIKNNEQLFQKAPEIKKILEDFIYEKENMSDFPWVKFRFQHIDAEVKFIFDYDAEGMCLLQHLYSHLKANSGRERMDYVSGIINDTRKLVEKNKDNRNGTE